MNYWAVGASFGGNQDVSKMYFADSNWFDGNAAKGGNKYKSVLGKVKIGDVLVMKSSATKGANHALTFTRLKAIGIVLKILNDHTFEVRWFHKEPKDFDSISYRKIIEPLREDEMKKHVISYINNYQSEQSYPMQQYISLLTSNKNLILTGAPGTGKTYLAKEIAKAMILPATSTNIKKDAFSTFYFDRRTQEEIDGTDEAWRYWKDKITANDFGLDDFANKVDLCPPELRVYGGYVMNFLERTSVTYGSSKPGTAYNYGIKLNNDNITYATSADNNRVKRDKAVSFFEENIKPYLQSLLSADLPKQIEMIEDNSKVIRATQLLRKIAVLEHPLVFLSVYQNETIWKAYRYYINGNESNFLAQSKALYDYFIKEYKLERTLENQFRVSAFIWKYFNKSSEEDVESFVPESNEEIEINIREKHIEYHTDFVQFHPSYDYTDFVEGLRPVKKGDTLGFELKNGTFKVFCKKALSAYKEDKHKDKAEKRKFVFIIDEINRAEIAKVFGELFYAIDPGYRGEKGAVSTQYANIQTKETIFDEDVFEGTKFYVPENVYIIGTMNDIDRSVESFDFAMRRRFAWIEVKAEDRKEMWDGQIEDWKDEAGKKMYALNVRISEIAGLGSSFHIGPAYFLKLKNYAGDFQQLWDNHIEVLLKEYLRGLPNAEEELANLAKAYKGGAI